MCFFKNNELGEITTFVCHEIDTVEKGREDLAMQQRIKSYERGIYLGCVGRVGMDS